MGYAGSQCSLFPEVLYRVTRALPTEGEVTVHLGDAVRPEDIVAVGQVAREPVTVMVGAALGVPARNVNNYLRRWAGESIQRDEILAEKKGLLGIGHKICRSPASGAIVSGPHSVGEVVIAPPEEEIAVRAGTQGRVAGILPGRGVVIECLAAVVQGVAGYGKDAIGAIHTAVESPDRELRAGTITGQLAGKVLVAGSAGRDAVIEAAGAEAAALVLGGISGEAYRWLLANRPNMAVMVTHGAGRVAMTGEVFELLRSRAGLSALVCRGGGGQVELVVSLGGPHKVPGPQPADLAVGARVRIEMGAHAGKLGRIHSFPPIPRKLASGVVTSVAELSLADGSRVIVARDNLTLFA